LPSEIEIKFKNSRKRIRIKFKEQRINPDLENEILQLEIPEEAQRVDLVEE
jgi:outer membrane lipoprotein-sorting protein